MRDFPSKIAWKTIDTSLIFLFLFLPCVFDVLAFQDGALIMAANINRVSSKSYPHVTRPLPDSLPKISSDKFPSNGI